MFLPNSLCKNDYFTLYNQIQKSQNWQKGEQQFKTAVKDYPEELAFHLYLNTFLRKQKKFSQAVDQIGKIFDKHPGNRNVLNAYVNTLVEFGWDRVNKKDNKGAYALFQKCHDLNPDDEWCLNGFGHSLTNNGMPGKAQEVLRRGKRKFPKNMYIKGNLSHAFQTMGWQQHKEGKIKAALKTFESAFEEDDTNDGILTDMEQC